MNVLPKQAAFAVVLAVSVVLVGSSELIQRAGYPVSEHYSIDDPLPPAPTEEPAVPLTPDQIPDLGPRPSGEPPAPTLLPGTSNEDLGRMLNGQLPDRLDGRPRLKCDDPPTIAAGESGTASCVLYPDAFRGPITVVGCGDTLVCRPAQKGPIEVMSDDQKRVDIVFDVPATETRNQFTARVEIYAVGDYYFPVEIIVPS